MGCVQNKRVSRSKETRAMNKTQESRRKSQKDKEQPPMTYSQPPLSIASFMIENAPDTNDEDVVKTES